MTHLHNPDITHLLTTYGYWAVMLIVGIESIGVPLPGEAVLVIAAVLAGSSGHSADSQHHFHIALVIGAAICGAVIGDNIGYWVGREFGYELLLRYGNYIRFDQRKMKLGQYMFLKHGGKVVFLGRFVAVLRMFAALLAGINNMPWGRFLVCNIAGAVVWATAFGMAGYYFGRSVDKFLSTFGIVALVAAAVALVFGIIFIRRHQSQLEDEAERAFPGPLAHHIGRRKR